MHDDRSMIKSNKTVLRDRYMYRDIVIYSSKCCDVTALVAIGNYQNNMASL